ncbi:hypothetical protein NC652_012176 [Populus alba x Populus x berolinensis]|uniref:Uncharacterized protein n=1 Tax=Populus alba x Populus x berolinensis TaxID=444605 RepID=A0AAD6R5N6_9ROSI|nr:hypothetical protein NC652_012176 [Populus alba x Populus x berolinensis]KAJ7002127.1 hypothetical protein NC653_012253 [Populus alba x Populus x berolinensis]
MARGGDLNFEESLSVLLMGAGLPSLKSHCLVACTYLYVVGLALFSLAMTYMLGVDFLYMFS